VRGHCGLDKGVHYTSENNPPGNADTERMMRTMKEECLGLQAWTNLFDLISAFEAWIAYDNDHYLHSSLGYKTPRQFEMAYYCAFIHRHTPANPG
jgi:putative transposase